MFITIGREFETTCQQNNGSRNYIYHKGNLCSPKRKKLQFSTMWMDTGRFYMVFASHSEDTEPGHAGLLMEFCFCA